MTADGVSIRPMERSDTDAVLDMTGELNGTGNAADPRYALTLDWRDGMRAEINERWFGRFQPFPPAFVAEAGGVLVGFVQGDILGSPPVLDRPPSARIGNLWVSPGWRRKGIATALVDAYVGAARARGYPWIEVGTLAKDARAVAFWKSMGFDDWKVILLSAD